MNVMSGNGHEHPLLTPVINHQSVLSDVSQAAGLAHLSAAEA